MNMIFRAAQHIFHYGLSLITAFVLFKAYDMQTASKEQSEKVHAENLARIEEAREMDRQQNEKVERLIEEVRHDVSVEISRAVLSVCRSQLDPNCEYLQSLLRQKSVKASEIGTTDQEVASLVQQYKTRYAAYYAANKQ